MTEGQDMPQAQDMGASSGSREPGLASRPGPSGFDPERIASMVRQLRGAKQWCCIFLHGGHVRHGSSELPFQAADALESLAAGLKDITHD